jgi:hypothetical protein
MRKWFLIAATLLMSSAWVVAQSSSTLPTVPNDSQSAQPTSASQQPGVAQEQEKDTKGTEEAGQSIEGCLTKVTGAYHLTESSGKVHNLHGDTHLLADHDGHWVQVWGAEVLHPYGTASSAGSPPTFNVTKMKMVSTTCPTK